MRGRILGSVVGGFFLLGGADAPAEAAQYNVTASAGNEGDAHESNSDPDAHASFTRSEDTATESYDAGANANGGSLHARALRSGLLSSIPISTNASATLSETIFIDETPSETITVRAQLGVAVDAFSNGGIAHALATLRLDGGTGTCQAGTAVNSVSGNQSLAGCSAQGSTSSSTLVELKLTPQQIAQNSHQITIDATVEASFENVAQILEAGASAQGGAGFAGLGLSPRGGEPIPGTVYIEIDPPTAHSFFGELTAFPVLPVPEPGAPLLLAAGAAVLGAQRRRVH